MKIGNLSTYNKDSDLSSYLDRFNFYIEANGIDDDRRKAVFLTVVGESTFSLIKDLIHPTTIQDTTFEKIIEVLKNHYEPQSSVIVHSCITLIKNQKALRNLWQIT